MSTVIVTPDLVGPVRNGGIGTFSFHLAHLLRRAGYPVTILFTGPLEVHQSRWLPDYHKAGIEVKIVSALERFPSSPSYHHFIALSEAVAEAIPSQAQVVYFQDWQANGFISVRQGRFRRQRPTYVTVLHGSSDWVREGAEEFPSDAIGELTLDFAERYMTQYSDAVISPSRFMLNWVIERGWHLPTRRYVLGLPVQTSAAPTSIVSPIVKSKRRFRRLVFFGRLETRKGFDLFISALQRLNQQTPDALRHLDEIVLLGKPGEHRYGSTDGAVEALRELPVMITILSDLESRAAVRFLTEHVDDSLIVIPSLQDNFPYTVIEASCIVGLNTLFAAVGGISEICAVPDRMFLPHLTPLVQALEFWLDRGPSEDILPPYDIAGANGGWLNFQETVLQLKPSVEGIVDVSTADTMPIVDVCVAYYNDGAYLPVMLHALNDQTSQAFKVIVVNDGSTDPESNRVFATMCNQYQRRGWQFIEKINTGASDSRNIAAQMGHAPYLCFVDSDNLPAPTMIERMLKGMEQTGEDCLTCYLSAFRSTPTGKPLYVYLPVGNAPELGLFFNTFGDTNFIIKRTVFEALGGFSTASPAFRYVGNEDYELLARLSLAGYTLDVIPEFLVYYRHSEWGIHLTSNAFQNTLRIQEVYRTQLRTLGMESIAPLAYGLHLVTQRLPSRLDHHDPEWLAHHIRWFDLLTAMRLKFAKQVRRRLVPFTRHVRGAVFPATSTNYHRGR